MIDKSKTHTHCIPKKIFRAIVKDILTSQTDKKLYWYTDAYNALQTDMEAYIIEQFEKANKLTQLSKNKTLHIQHFKNLGWIGVHNPNVEGALSPL